MTRPRTSVSVLVLLAASGVTFASGTTVVKAPVPAAATEFTAGFEVQALIAGAWQAVGDLRFGLVVGEGSLVVPQPALAADVRVRLVQHGGGAAFIDAVGLDGQPPLRVAGLAEAGAEGLVARRDDDLVDALGRTVELTFAPSSGEGRLRLSARVEGPVIHGSPFSFPPENLFRPVTADSKFYRYTPRVGNRAPDWPHGLGAESALFAEPCRPTTGHPDGTTYGWVANDDEKLYAAIEFTPDNTRDGVKDWSSMWVLSGGETREFRISEADTRWGRPSFQATERAPYRHKLYTFEIPLREIGIGDIVEAGHVDLAFEAYGTAAVAIAVNPTLWDFGAILVGSAAPLQTFTVFAGSAGVTLATPWYTRTGPDTALFPLTAGTCVDGMAIPAFGTCTFQVGFTPNAVGSFQDSIVIAATIVGGPSVETTATVLGQGVEPIPLVGGGAIAVLVALLLLAGALFLRRVW